MSDSTEPSAPVLSVVVPVYGCADCLRELWTQVAAAMRELGERWELVLVDDRAGDGSWDVATELATAHPEVHALRLSRNFGQHAAITAGLAAARGTYTVVMDCDLQDDPSYIPEMYELIRDGHDVVLGRRKRKKMAWHRRMAGNLYFRLLGAMTGSDIDGEIGSFSMVTRNVRNAYLRLEDRNRHYVLILNWMGFDTAYVDIEHRSRHAGETGYSLRGLVRHALDGMLFQTTVMLRWIIYSGFVVACLGLVLAAGLVTQRLLNDAVYPGWTSLAVLVLVTSGMVMVSTGVAGLYIGAIFEQVKQRPLYLISDEVGGPSAAPSHEPAGMETIAERT